MKTTSFASQTPWDIAPLRPADYSRLRHKPEAPVARPAVDRVVEKSAPPLAKKKSGDNPVDAIFAASEQLNAALQAVDARQSFLDRLEGLRHAGKSIGPANSVALWVMERRLRGRIRRDPNHLYDIEKLDRLTYLRKGSHLDDAELHKMARASLLARAEERRAELAGRKSLSREDVLLNDWRNAISTARESGIGLPAAEHRQWGELVLALPPGYGFEQRGRELEALLAKQVPAGASLVQRGKAQDELTSALTTQIKALWDDAHRVLDSGNPFFAELALPRLDALEQLLGVVRERGLDLTFYFDAVTASVYGRTADPLVQQLGGDALIVARARAEAMMAYRDFIADKNPQGIVEWREWGSREKRPRHDPVAVEDVKLADDAPRPELAFTIDRQRAFGLETRLETSVLALPSARKALFGIDLERKLFQGRLGSPGEPLDPESGRLLVELAVVDFVQDWRRGKSLKDCDDKLDRLEQVERLVAGELSPSQVLVQAHRRIGYEIESAYDFIKNAIAGDHFIGSEELSRRFTQARFRFGQAGRLGVTLPVRYYQMMKELTDAKAHIDAMHERRLEVEHMRPKNAPSRPTPPDTLELPAGADALERIGLVRRAVRQYGDLWLVERVAAGETFGLAADEVRELVRRPMEDVSYYWPPSWILDVLDNGNALPAEQFRQLASKSLNGRASSLVRDIRSTLRDGLLFQAEAVEQQLAKIDELLAAALKRGLDLDTAKERGALGEEVSRFRQAADRLRDFHGHDLVPVLWAQPVEAEEGVSKADLVRGIVNHYDQRVPLASALFYGADIK